MGVDPDEAADSGRTKGYTALAILMMAAGNNQFELAKLLISYKADVNRRADDGTSALASAKGNSSEEMITLLKIRVSLHNYQHTLVAFRWAFALPVLDGIKGPAIFEVLNNIN